MKLTRWKDLPHKSSPERQAEIDCEVRSELDRMGLAALRKARQQTQVELAEELGIPQASISHIENRTDLLLSTLSKYIHALGGELEIRAIFPEITFNLAHPGALLGLNEEPAASAKKTDRKVA